METIEKYLVNGLRNGYTQNRVLHTSYLDNESSIIEYLLTVNVAQELIEWNSNNSYSYSIFLEQATETFFKSAFLPYMEVGNDIFDMKIIHPEVLKSIDTNTDIRVGRLDLAVCREKGGFLNYKESLVGIELKGINPNIDKVIADVKRLVLAIEMKDDKFKNSILKCYCLHIKKLGGDKRLSKKTDLENAMHKSIVYLKDAIAKKATFTTTTFDLTPHIIDIKTVEDFNAQGNKEDLSADEVAEGTKIVYSVIIKIERK